MKRMHINLTTADLPRSVAFYTELFEHAPTVLEADYAKWSLEDPRVNFSLSTHGGKPGIDHLGMEADGTAEFERLRARLRDSTSEVFEQPDVTCCYANSSKAWVRDPDGVAWETFITHGANATYGDGSAERAATGDEEAVQAACCIGAAPQSRACCG